MLAGSLRRLTPLLVLIAAAGLCLHLPASYAKERTVAKSIPKQKSYPLTQKTNGIAGKLLIAASADKQQLVIQIVTDKGEAVMSRQLDYGSISPNAIKDSPDWFGYSVDRSAGFGSYNGVETEFFRIRNGQIEWLTAEDRKTGKTEKVHLMKSLKTAWKIINRPTSQVLAVACRPDLKSNASVNDEMDFITIYARYYKKDTKWFRAAREEKGFLEFEDGSDFPPESLFPR